MSSLGKAASIGAALAVVALVAAVIAIRTGAIELPASDAPVDTVVIIATVPAEDGGQIAPIAFMLKAGTKPRVLDTMAAVVTPGTTAVDARSAYPFGGGAAVTAALASQAGPDHAWVVLPSEVWSKMLAGSTDTVDVPQGLSVYMPGKLTVLSQGERALSGDEAVALASALDYIRDDATRAEVARRLSGVVASAVVKHAAELPALVDSGQAKASVPGASLAGLAAR